MNKRIKALWTSALLSDKYQQGHDRLRTVTPDGPKDCCLGVLCDLFAQERPEEGKWDEDGAFLTPHDHDDDNCSFGNADGSCDVKYDEEESELPEIVAEWADLDETNPTLGAMAASEHNDGDVQKVRKGAKTFAEIAALIEKHL